MIINTHYLICTIQHPIKANSASRNDHHQRTTIQKKKLSPPPEPNFEKSISPSTKPLSQQILNSDRNIMKFPLQRAFLSNSLLHVMLPRHCNLLIPQQWLLLPLQFTLNNNIVLSNIGFRGILDIGFRDILDI